MTVLRILLCSHSLHSSGVSCLSSCDRETINMARVLLRKESLRLLTVFEEVEVYLSLAGGGDVWQ